MCGNRVEELESRVKELEASVEGLTDELVECKVRIRELEDALGEDLEFAPTDAGVDAQTQARTQTQFEAESDANADTAEPGESSEEDDIIVA